MGFTVCSSPVLPLFHPSHHCGPLPVQMETCWCTVQVLLSPYTCISLQRKLGCWKEKYGTLEPSKPQCAFWELKTPLSPSIGSTQRVQLITAFDN